MRYKVLLLATLALCCSAQVRPTATGHMAPAPHGASLAATAALPPSDFLAPTALPPVSALVRNGILSLVVNPSSGVPLSELGQIATSAGDTPLSDSVDPRGVTLPIRISDVTGLSEALSQINTSIASLTTTTSNLNTTLTNLSATVNTLSSAVSNLVPVPTFVDFEMPAGSINGTNPVFTLNAAPSPPSSLVLSKNGMKLVPGGDYSLSGTSILFSAGAVPQTGDQLVASYRLAHQ